MSEYSATGSYAMRATNGRMDLATRRLGLSRKGLHLKRQRLGLSGCPTSRASRTARRTRRPAGDEILIATHHAVAAPRARLALNTGDLSGNS